MIVYADECGVYLLPMVRATWAAKGQTPILREHSGYDHLSIIGAISPSGNLIFWCRKTAFDGDATADFLALLAHCYRKQRLTVIWDGATIHAAQPVKTFLVEHPAKIQLEKLPGYSPELNPIELLWALLKERMANPVFLNLNDLYEAVCYELRSIAKDKKLIRAFFHKESISFFP